jgi:two-component system alkaline phosphatase synthesis response regulator PhoP
MIKILAVDDDAMVLAVIKKRLEFAGYEVITAMEGLEGLKKARSENPDLIVLDLILPNLNGYQICAMLKRDSNYRKIPIIMLTSRSQQADIAEGMKAGADAYITKPYDPDEFIAKIQTLLTESQQNKTKEQPEPGTDDKKKKEDKSGWWDKH